MVFKLNLNKQFFERSRTAPTNAPTNATAPTYEGIPWQFYNSI